MSMLDIIKDVIYGTATRMHDDVFGEVRCERGNLFDRDTFYWSTAAPIPLGEDIAIFLGAGCAAGPSLVQCQQLVELRTKWPAIKPELTPQLHEEFRAWFEGCRANALKQGDAKCASMMPHLSSDADDVWKHLDVPCIRLCESSSKTGDIDIQIEFLYLDGEHDSDHSMHVAIRNWMIEFVGIEG
jgi:hypothetical protein